MRILIIGAGDIGFQLGKRLSLENHDLTIIDLDGDKVQRAQDHFDGLTIEGSGSSYADLKRANVSEMDLVAAVTDSDEVNLVACRLAKATGVPRTIARVRNPEYTQPNFILSPEELGIDHIIHPEKEAALAVVQLLSQSCATYAVEFEDGKIQVLGVRLDANSPLTSAPLANFNGYQDEHLRIVAIKRGEETIIPRGHDQPQVNDQVFAVCDHNYISDYLTLTGKKDHHASNILIFGGGLIAKFIAQEAHDKANIKIIESDEKKAHQLACALPHALVIHGDGTDVDLLNDEGLADMDAFIAVTGSDESNIISVLMARHAHVPQCIALVNKIEYLSVTPSIGMDAVVSKQVLTVNAVQHLIQQEIADIASPPGMNAKLVEFIAGNRSRITRKPLRQIRFPQNAIVGAVMRNTDVIIPHGDTQIEPGDKTIVFTLPQALDQVERLFG